MTHLLSSLAFVGAALAQTADYTQFVDPLYVPISLSATSILFTPTLVLFTQTCHPSKKKNLTPHSHGTENGGNTFPGVVPGTSPHPPSTTNPIPPTNTPPSALLRRQARRRRLGGHHRRLLGLLADRQRDRLQHAARERHGGRAQIRRRLAAARRRRRSQPARRSQRRARGARRGERGGVPRGARERGGRAPGGDAACGDV